MSRMQGASTLACPSAARQGGVTKQTANDVPPRRGWPLLGCNCVTYRLRIAEDTRHSSFLVSLQNRLSQIRDIISSQPPVFINNYRKYLSRNVVYTCGMCFI